MIQLQFDGDKDSGLPDLIMKVLHSHTTDGIASPDTRTGLSCWQLHRQIETESSVDD